MTDRPKLGRGINPVYDTAKKSFATEEFVAQVEAIYAAEEEEAAPAEGVDVFGAALDGAVARFAPPEGMRRKSELGNPPAPKVAVEAAKQVTADAAGETATVINDDGSTTTPEQAEWDSWYDGLSPEDLERLQVAKERSELEEFRAAAIAQKVDAELNAEANWSTDDGDSDAE
jgi:hypothetical protein